MRRRIAVVVTWHHDGQVLPLGCTEIEIVTYLTILQYIIYMSRPQEWICHLTALVRRHHICLEEFDLADLWRALLHCLHAIKCSESCQTNARYNSTVPRCGALKGRAEPYYGIPTNRPRQNTNILTPHFISLPAEQLAQLCVRVRHIRVLQRLLLHIFHGSSSFPTESKLQKQDPIH